ncbi:hypothetical protein [Actinophytocola sp.]|uniref:hypothetical protein n=1 Tax=Actinophytocola sp. TaxID=1872138 RepID=UPI00389A8BF8
MRVLPILAALLLLAGCGDAPAARTPFTRVDLPPGVVATRIAAAGDALVVGVSRHGRPGMLRYAHGRATEVGVVPATPYGKVADWFSVTADGQEILAVGGRSGGAHMNVRWSVWRTRGTELVEQPQRFSAFGGYGAGALVDGVLPTSGPLLVGVWQGASEGSDAALWTTDGTTWNRQSSAGTPLESTGNSLKFPMSAAAHGADVLVAGWQLAGGKQQAVVWTVRDGRASLVTLPGGGKSAEAMAVSCADTCSVAGRVDGRLAVWRQGRNTWRRVPDVPDVPVGDDDRPVPPLGDTLVYSDRGSVRVATLDGDISDAVGPTGVVTAVARVGDTTYVLAGPDGDEDNRTLWRADLG